MDRDVQVDVRTERKGNRRDSRAGQLRECASHDVAAEDEEDREDIARRFPLRQKFSGRETGLESSRKESKRSHNSRQSSKLNTVHAGGAGL